MGFVIPAEAPEILVGIPETGLSFRDGTETGREEGPPEYAVVLRQDGFPAPAECAPFLYGQRGERRGREQGHPGIEERRRE